MQAFKPDFLTAFGMIALSAFTVSWVMWILGRQYWRQGMSHAVFSTAVCGVAYTIFALQAKLGIIELQVIAKTLISVAIASFTIALQRFRESHEWVRDTALMWLPIAASFALAVIYLPQDLTGFNRMQTVVTVLQTFSTLHVLYRLHSNSPGAGWKLVTAAILIQLLSIVPLVFVKDRPSPAAGAAMPLDALLAMWGLCLVLFLKLVISSIGFLIMLRDRQAALERHKALLDPLTQLPNRAALVRDMTSAICASASNQRPMAVLLMDIDYFKRFNDQHGHLAGDQVIQTVARILKQQSRAKDIVSRYGGEEFVLVLPDTLPHEAEIAALRLCNAIRHTSIVLPSGIELHVTVSVGIHSSIPLPGQGWQPLVAAADEAMYAAKRGGRDRISISSTSLSPSAAFAAA